MTNTSEILSFIQEKHAGQKRAGGVPTWHHLARVSKIVGTVLEKYKEGSEIDRAAIIRAAYGHDLLEDTTATKEEIESIFGIKEYLLIVGATNEQGDDDVRPYVQKMSGAEEAVRLIKLADLYDNLTNVTYALFDLGHNWTTSYFLRVVTPMYEMICETTFPVYNKTSDELKMMVKNSFVLLHDELTRYNPK